MIVLNLGCGTKVSSDPRVVNIDWSITLRLRRSGVLSKLALPLLSAGRRERFERLPDNIRVHDLSRGIPYDDQSVDAVYNSHMLEHLDRPVAEQFLHEARRVLVPGGIHRIVVPDFETLCRNYLAHVDRCDQEPERSAHHDEYIGVIIEQISRRESAGTAEQAPLRRTFENLLLGDARKRGETHQWMYDRTSLSRLLTGAGYHDVRVHSFATSSIPGWNGFGLDLTADDAQYKPDSLYIEARA